jgi:hypothetical protein
VGCSHPMRVTIAQLLAAVLVATGTAATGTAARAAAPVHAAPTLRFGIDPQPAGSAGTTQGPVAPVDVAKTVRALRALRPPGRALVIRLNRLFESDGRAGIRRFQRLVRRDDRAGFDSEIQVRYHPSPAQAGDMADWIRFVRRVVDTFGPDPRVVALTITNEINLAISPNTSDGAYPRAERALIDGILAAHREAMRRGYRQLRLGFTYAYRFDPTTDARMFTDLHRAGPAFRHALSFVGVDYYPELVPGRTTPIPRATRAMLRFVRHHLMPLGGLGPDVPIWITETGYDMTPGLVDGAQQRQALQQIVTTVARDAAREHVTDLRWFNLRDNAPGATGFGETSGLETADYRRKPAFGALRRLIARYGARGRARARAPAPLRAPAPPQGPTPAPASP